MSDFNPLYGDAKATAKTAAGDRKIRVLEEARNRFDQDSSSGNQAVLAKAYFDLGRYAEAEKLLTGLVESGKPDLQLLSDLAFVYKNLKQTDKAKEVFLKIIKVSPRHPLARSAENEIWQLDPDFKPSWMRRD